MLGCSLAYTFPLFNRDEEWKDSEVGEKIKDIIPKGKNCHRCDKVRAMGLTPPDPIVKGVTNASGTAERCILHAAAQTAAFNPDIVSEDGSFVSISITGHAPVGGEPRAKAAIVAYDGPARASTSAVTPGIKDTFAASRGYHNGYDYRVQSQGHGLKFWSNPSVGNEGDPLTCVVGSMLHAAFLATSICCQREIPQGGEGGEALATMREALLPKLKAITDFLSSENDEMGMKKVKSEAKEGIGTGDDDDDDDEAEAEAAAVAEATKPAANVEEAQTPSAEKAEPAGGQFQSDFVRIHQDGARGRRQTCMHQQPALPATAAAVCHRPLGRLVDQKRPRTDHCERFTYPKLSARR